jgi:ribosomal protein L16 Arg81 hydroxylase
MTSFMNHLGDMPIETFLRDYWQKKPLLIRNAFPHFESPIDGDELAGLALEEEVESRLILEKGIGNCSTGRLTKKYLPNCPKPIGRSWSKPSINGCLK